MKRLIVITTLFLGISMALAPTVNATSGSIEKDCSVVRFTGSVNNNDLARLEVRLHDTADSGSPMLQDDYIVINPGSFDVTVPWVANPDGRLYRTAISVSTDSGSNWSLLVLDDDFLECVADVGTKVCRDYQLDAQDAAGEEWD